MKTINTWSFSRLSDYESCPYKAWLKHAERVPDPKPKPAADRGTAIHALAENYLRGNIDPLPVELSKFAEEFRSLRDSGRTLRMEEEWGFDNDWEPTAYRGPETWGRMKIDLCCEIKPGKGLVVDFKTGKKFGNEVKHGEQTQLYSIAAFIMHPEWTSLTTELWYLDIDEMSQVEVPLKKFELYKKVFDRRLRAMTEATEFPPKPNILSCKWCPYGDTGHCEVRHTDEQATKNFYKRKFGGK